MTINLSTLSRDWLGHSQEYRPSAFWFWNSDMAHDAMRAAAEKIASAGVREVVFHPIHGMEIEYLSPDYFERVRYGLALAKELGLKVWIYDEFGWPSGNAGGKLLREHPEHRGWILEFRRDVDGRIVAEPVQSEMVLDNVVGASWARGEGGYLDTLSDRAVQCFIDLTYERVYQECGSLFEDTVAGFFTDEPTTMAPRFQGDNFGPWTAIGLPWTPLLPALFRERYGYDIVPRYADLAGDHPGQIKRDYWDLAKDLYAEAYYGRIARWCREHGVRFTGHAGEDTLLMQSRFSGSLYRCLSRMDEPGIDFLGAGPEPDHRFVELVTVASVARHAGRDRIYCEAFGISPCDLRPGQMLRRVQGLSLRGCNDIALMGFHQDQGGLRKSTYWPSLFDRSPWWGFYPELRDGIARSVALASLGDAVARYAILYPQDELEQTDLFLPASGADDPASRSVIEIGLAVYAAGETFDFVFPEILDEARVAEGRIVFPHAGYDALIVPGELSVDDAVRQKVDALCLAGGRVLKEPSGTIAASIAAAAPSWADRVCLGHDGKAGDIRVSRWIFPDGELYALRNASDREVCASVTGDGILTEWDAATGEIKTCLHRGGGVVRPFATRYFSLTRQPLAAAAADAVESVPIALAWRIECDGPNTQRLSCLRFRHPERGWLPAEGMPLFGVPLGDAENGIPRAFSGETEIAMEAEFACAAVPARLAIACEEDHLRALWMNGAPVDLARSEPIDAWARSCRQVDVAGHVRVGRNVLQAVLRYRRGETTLESEAFFWYGPMPSADIVLVGDFQAPGGALSPVSGEPQAPGGLTELGVTPLNGMVRYRAAVTVTGEEAARIRGLRADLIAENGLEILLDGRSLGRRIVAPYEFALPEIAAGVHEIEARVAAAYGPVPGTRSPWGLRALNWLMALA